MATGMFSGGAAFGVFPQMQPRRRFQDPEASANVPLDVTRGRFAGLAGLLPDTLNFMGRSPMPTEMFGDTQYEPTPQMPYGSEYYLQNLPLKPTSRIGEVAGQAGAFVPLNPMPAARAVAAGARALGPTAVGMGERYLQRQGLMPGVVEGESVGMLGGPIKPQAPVSELGFYSATEQAALNLPRKSGTGESFLNDLMKGQDVKKDELSWLGLDDYLKGKPNVTRQEVQDFIASNRVDVREVRLGDKEVKLPSTIGLLKREEILNKYQPKLDALYAEDANYANLTPQRYEELGQEIRALERQRDVEADAAYVIPPLPQLTPTKYQQYQLPGGENYREILLTLPKEQPKVVPLEGGGGRWGIQMPDGTITSRYYDWDDAAQALRFDAQKAGVTYTSSHFKEPNILAHMRVNDRIDADGKKMLLIEEIQSDWHQAGKLEGYQNKSGLSQEQIAEKQKEIFNRFDAGEITREQRNAEINSLDASKEKLQGVPDAPFKDTWHQLALKRALKYAADNGYDRVGLTTGRQQVERYANEMRQNVDEIQFQTGQKLTDSQANELQLLRNKARDEGLSKLNGTERQRYDNLLNNEGEYVGKNQTKIKAFKGSDLTFSGIVKDGKFLDGPAAGKTVTEVLGKSMAKKIAEQRTGTIKGDDLTIGGEGMKAYYDEIYPAFLAKQGKKYNAKTGETTIGKKGTIEKAGTSYYQTPDTNATVRYIDISPEMRGGVKKGQPLFTAAPIGGIGLGAGTQDNEMPDAVRQYMADPRYSDPFADTTR